MAYAGPMETVHRQRQGAVPPASRYSQAIEASSGLRWLFVSGQIGVRPDGTIAGDHAGQHAQAFANVLALLEEAGMGPEHLVRVNTYLVGREQVPLYRQARDRALGDAAPSSTVVLVAGLADERWVVEVEVVAAAP